MQAKSLGEKVKRVKVMRIILYVVLAIVAPTLFVTIVLFSVGILTTIMSTIFNIVLIVGIIVFSGIAIALLRSVYPWINVQLLEFKRDSQGNISDALVATIRNKSAIIVASLIVIFLLVIGSVLTIIFGLQLPLRLISTVFSVLTLNLALALALAQALIIIVLALS